MLHLLSLSSLLLHALVVSGKQLNRSDFYSFQKCTSVRSADLYGSFSPQRSLNCMHACTGSKMDENPARPGCCMQASTVVHFSLLIVCPRAFGSAQDVFVAGIHLGIVALSLELLWHTAAGGRHMSSFLPSGYKVCFSASLFRLLSKF